MTTFPLTLTVTVLVLVTSKVAKVTSLPLGDLNLTGEAADTTNAVNVYDLTYNLGNTSVFWPGQPPFNFTILRRGYFGPAQIWWEANYFGMGEHGGTHIDSPAHFAKGRWRTHQIPASNLMGPGIVLDVKNKTTDNPLYAVTKEDFLQWEAVHGIIPEHAVVLVKFGWGDRYPDPKLVFNTEDPEDPSTYRFPGLGLDAVNWLVDNRNLTAIGVDTATPDVSNASDFPAHRILLGNDVLILEYVANLDTLPPRGFYVIIGVIKLEDGSGGPARILAISGAEAAGGYHVPNAVVMVVVAMMAAVSVGGRGGVCF
ncbi:isatin hydrolase-like [Babylonia areolata]|uniref:isatin hydrolase-like n=1 Tax=Babylonia areolata TaxID=304850 RepID=UPI003FD45A20